MKDGRITMKSKLCFILISVIFVVSGCVSRARPTEAAQPGAAGGQVQSVVQPQMAAWPTKEWQVSTPQQQGMDAALLDRMQEKIRDDAIELDSLLIVRNGYIVSETYYSSNKANSKHAMYSVTKSFVSTLVGIALDQGLLKGVDQRVVDLLPGATFANDDARKQAMTLENLLTMTSGLDWEEGDPIYRKMYASDDWVQMVMDIPMKTDGGKQFLYCSGCSHVLSAIVEQASGKSTTAFAEENLFKPLGITNQRWEADRKGIAIGGWGLNITPRDMAKLGYLFLNNGSWDGKQVVSSGWVSAATRKHIGTGGRLGYGYQWWIYPTHGAYTALGRFGQTIFVAPDLNLVIVTTAHIESGHDQIYKLIDDYILPAAEADN